MHLILAVVVLLSILLPSFIVFLEKKLNKSFKKTFIGSWFIGLPLLFFNLNIIGNFNIIIIGISFFLFQALIFSGMAYADEAFPLKEEQ